MGVRVRTHYASIPIPHGGRLDHEALRLGEEHSLPINQVMRLPVCCSTAGGVISKVKIVETIEAATIKCGDSLQGSAGRLKYGGHTLRVTGAQALAAAGVDISKARTLARHSGEAVYRYVALAPLTMLRIDLVLPSSGPEPAAAATPVLKPQQLMKMVQALTGRVEVQEQTLRAVSTTSQQAPAEVYVQSVPTLAVHKLRPGDATRTACGWPMGPARQRRGRLDWLTNIIGEPWSSLCERCLLPERRSAKMVACKRRLAIQPRFSPIPRVLLSAIGSFHLVA